MTRALGILLAATAVTLAPPMLGCGGCPRAGRATSGANETEQFVASHETPDHTVVIEDAFSISETGEAIALPPLHPDHVVAVIIAGSPDLRRCYESALTEHPTASGRLVLEIHVRADGHVIDARVAESAIDDGVLTDCFSQRARHWHFPASAHDVTLLYPFDLSPDDASEAETSTEPTPTATAPTT